MAKRQTAIARPSVIVMKAPTRRGALRRRASGALRKARHHGGRAARAAAPTTSMALGGLAVGYAQAKGWLDKIPTIGGSRAMTLAIAGYAATRFSKNQTIRTAGLAALVAGAFDYGRVQGGKPSSLQGDFEGDGTEGDFEGDFEGDDQF